MSKPEQPGLPLPGLGRGTNPDIPADEQPHLLPEPTDPPDPETEEPGEEPEHEEPPIIPTVLPPLPKS